MLQKNNYPFIKLTFCTFLGVILGNLTAYAAHLSGLVIAQKAECADDNNPVTSIRIKPEQFEQGKKTITTLANNSITIQNLIKEMDDGITIDCNYELNATPQTTKSVFNLLLKKSDANEYKQQLKNLKQKKLTPLIAEFCLLNHLDTAESKADVDSIIQEKLQEQENVRQLCTQPITFFNNQKLADYFANQPSCRTVFNTMHSPYLIVNLRQEKATYGNFHSIVKRSDFVNHSSGKIIFATLDHENDDCIKHHGNAYVHIYQINGPEIEEIATINHTKTDGEKMDSLNPAYPEKSFKQAGLEALAIDRNGNFLAITDSMGRAGNHVYLYDIKKLNEPKLLTAKPFYMRGDGWILPEINFFEDENRTTSGFILSNAGSSDSSIYHISKDTTKPKLNKTDFPSNSAVDVKKYCIPLQVASMDNLIVRVNKNNSIHFFRNTQNSVAEVPEYQININERYLAAQKSNMPTESGYGFCIEQVNLINGTLAILCKMRGTMDYNETEETSPSIALYQASENNFSSQNRKETFYTVPDNVAMFALSADGKRLALLYDYRRDENKKLSTIEIYRVEEKELILEQTIEQALPEIFPNDSKKNVTEIVLGGCFDDTENFVKKANRQFDTVQFSPDDDAFLMATTFGQAYLYPIDLSKIVTNKQALVVSTWFNELQKQDGAIKTSDFSIEGEVKDLYDRLPENMKKLLKAVNPIKLLPDQLPIPNVTGTNQPLNKQQNSNPNPTNSTKINSSFTPYYLMKWATFCAITTFAIKKAFFDYSLHEWLMRKWQVAQ